jgi:transcriptional antiterminator RfaH
MGQSLPQSPSLNWIVVNTHPHREPLALSNLERQGYVLYCPMVAKRVRHARQTRDVLRPMFPSYVFVACDAQGQLWRPILSTFGVRSVVRSSDAPILLNGAVIAALKAREVNGVVRRPDMALEVGQNVRVEGGPLNGLIGQVLEMREKDRVLVLLRLLNQQTKVLVTSNDLHPLHASASAS